MLSRRQIIHGSAAFAVAPLAGGCSPLEAQPTAPIPALKDAAPCPVGTCAMTGQLDDPAWNRLALTHFNQITPEWEMKM
ncbi:MAG: 1,4-beta-xylanase, partial [Brevundimonas sp.]